MRVKYSELPKVWRDLIVKLDDVAEASQLFLTDQTPLNRDRLRFVLMRLSVYEKVFLREEHDSEEESE